MADASLIERLVTALRRLPGVGPKSAQRMAFHLLERDREGGRALAGALAEAMDRVGQCALCRTFSETEICALCDNPARDRTLLCVVESPADVAAIESGTAYRGLFFVLMGHLSPLDGIGPDAIGLDLLGRRLDSGGIEEVILATGSTVEGQATAHFISEMVREKGVRATRIAQGVPLGGELEYLDGGTLSHALSGRQEF